MPSRLSVVLVSLLLAAPTVVFWLWLVILSTREAIQCPEECRCEAGGIYVHCLDSGLNIIPSILPTNVRILVLDGNSITYFENDSFVSRGLVELEILKADFCQIRTIQFGAFNGLTKLKNLSLWKNEITEIIPGTFEKMSRLEYLDLMDNRIERLELDVFSGLINLQIVYLGFNNLQYIHPHTFVGLPNLQSLYLSNNAELPVPTDRHFINSHSLKQLDISGCYVSSVSFETFANVSVLETLDLNYNNLTTVDINILKTLPKLSTLYLYDNPLQCDCQLQEVWRWCEDHNIRTAYKKTAPECDTPREVEGMWWGVLEKGECLQGKIHYYGDYTNTSYNYTIIEDTGTDKNTDVGTPKDMDTDTESEQNAYVSRVLKLYEVPIFTVPFMFGTAGNVILIIIITCNKDMRTLPNMYILNVAISDMIYLMVLFFETCANTISDTWLYGGSICSFISFFRRLSIGLSTYSVAVLSIQRYRVMVYPFQVRVSSRSNWRTTCAIICGVWIVASLFAIPAGLFKHFCNESPILENITYYQRVVIFELLVSCVLPLCVIAFSYIMTAHHIMKSSYAISECTQNSQLNTRKNTAKVVLGLIVVFLISYVPHHAFRVYVISTVYTKFSVFNLTKLILPTLPYTLLVLKCLLLINSCLNPVALCCTSSAFRRQFKRYLICCRKTNSPPNDLERRRRN
jgi:hypothetical protein